MTFHHYGNEIFSTTRSLKLATVWTLIFALPVWVLLDAYSESKNTHLILFSLLLLSPAIYLFIVKLTDRLSVYEKAIVLKTLWGSKRIALNKNTKIYIEQITDNMYGVSVAKHAKIRLKNGDQSLRIPSGFMDLGSVIDYLEHFQQNVILPHAIDDLNHNKPLNFDILEIKKNGLIFKKKVFRWEDISRLQLEGGVLRLYGHEGRLLGGADAYSEIKYIANFATCLAILSQLTSLRF